MSKQLELNFKITVDSLEQQKKIRKPMQRPGFKMKSKKDYTRKLKHKGVGCE